MSSVMKGYLKVDAVGTSLCGYLHATYSELVAVFGRPHERNQATANTKASWTFRHKKTGLEMDIYDYSLNEGGRANDVTVWHVGTHTNKDKDVFAELHRIFPAKKICDFRYDVIHPALYTVRVAFGTEMSDKAEEKGKDWLMKQKVDGNEIVEKHFTTMEAANAFIEGIELASGWMESCHYMM